MQEKKIIQFYQLMLLIVLTKEYKNVALLMYLRPFSKRGDKQNRIKEEAYEQFVPFLVYGSKSTR